MREKLSRSIVKFSRTPPHSLFFVSRSLSVKTEVEKLLMHTVKGEQIQAEAMLEKNTVLALHAGRVTDYANRTFNFITPFQYAVWSFDWHMWKMLLKFLSKKDARLQLDTLDSLKTEHGLGYSFEPLIVTSQIYLANFDTWTCEQLGIHWCVDIGTAQKNSVAHVANEFCHPFQSFLPTPNFTDPVLPRNLTLVDGNPFFPVASYSIGELGKDFAVFRWNKKHAGIGTMKPCPNARVTTQTDLKALIALRDTRISQRVELKRQLEEPVISLYVKKT